jgi:hypothetical protein
MDHISIASKSQENIHVQSKIDDFFNRFQIGTLLHHCGVRKRHGHKDLPFGKDAAYQLLKGTTYNWRRLLLGLGQRLHRFFNRLTDEDRETVLIIDDSSYDRSRSKLVELLCRVYDHSTRRYLKGFRMLTMCWSDGVSCLPLDFSLLSSSDSKKRLCDSQKVIDKRCCACQRRKEAIVKATGHLEAMFKRILSTGIHAQYLLMDSWFTMPATVTALAEHIDVIGMVKRTPNVFYRHNGHQMNLMSIYAKLKKRRGRAKILTSTLVQLKDGRLAKLVFVRDKRKKDWLALLSTDTILTNKDIVRIYGKRWDIEVFFKMAKQHLRVLRV